MNFGELRVLKTISSVVALMVCMSPTSAQDLSIDVYGGFSPDSTLAWDGDNYGMDTGTALGFGIYTSGLIEGFAIGVDFMASGADYTGYSDSISAVSLMAAGRYAIPLNDNLSATLAGGLGAMRVTYDLGQQNNGYSSGTSTVFGGQAEIGLRYQLENGPAFFGAVKYQSNFDDVEFDDGLVVEYNTTSLILGVSLDL